MSREIVWLITLCDIEHETLCRCAVKMAMDHFPESDWTDCPMEYRNAIFKLLPGHIRAGCKIVCIESIDGFCEIPECSE